MYLLAFLSGALEKPSALYWNPTMLFYRIKNYYPPLIKCLALLMLTITLSACWLDQYTGSSQTFYNNAKQRYWLNKLRQANLQIIHRGDHVRLIIASDYLFPIDNEKVKPRARALLQDIAHLVRSYKHPVFVLVAASTDGIGSDVDQRIRSVRQARQVGAYLWHYGIPHHQIKIIGWGDTHPLSSYETVSGRTDNRRVEIEILS